MVNGRAAVTIIVIAALGAGGFFAGRYLLAGGGSEAQQPTRLDQQIAPRQTEQAAGARFEGELLGIALAPSMDRLPQWAQDEQKRVAAGGRCVDIPVAQARAIDFPRPLVLPEGFAPDTARPGVGAVACGGKVSGISWGYAAAGPAGTPASVLVARVTTRYDTPDAAASRVLVQVINGRQAIVVKPAAADGLTQRSWVFFPEPFGMTAIYAFNLSEADLLKLAAAVAEASR